MNRLPPHARQSLKDLAQRVDAAAGHLNVLLVVIALGLATLDFTFFLTEKVVDALPPITHISYDTAQSSPHSQTSPN